MPDDDRERRRRAHGDSEGEPRNERRRHSHKRSRSRRSRSASPRARRDHHESASTHSESSEMHRSVRPRRQCWYAVDYDPIKIGSIDGTDTIAHDKALTRASKARFDPSKDSAIQGDPDTTLFVARLSYDTTEETLQQVFQQYGQIKRLRLVRDVVTRQSRGYAFVEFESERAFRVAYQRAHRQEIDGRTILVDYERSRVMEGWKPRRLGGGLGGKKESGQLRFGGRDHPFKPPRIGDD